MYQCKYVTYRIDNTIKLCFKLNRRNYYKLFSSEKGITMILFILFSLLLIIIVTIVTQWVVNYLMLWKKLSAIPAPKNKPFVGLSLEATKISREDRFRWFNNLCYEIKEGILVLWIGTEPLVVIRKPHQMEAILPSNTLITKSRGYDAIKIWLGEGLVTSTGAHWFNHRRLITPAFHFGVLEEYAGVMREKVEILNECIQKQWEKNPKAPINIFELAVKYTLDTICETAMGINIDSQRQKDIVYVNALHTFSRLHSERFMRPWLKLDSIYYLTENGKELSNSVKIMHAFTEKVIKQKQSERQEVKVEGEKKTDDFDEIGKHKRKAFLDLLLDASENTGNQLSFKELREEVDTFMFAGHDTTSTAISWALFCLGNAPDIQSKVHEELKETYGSSNETATTKNLAQLKYLDRVIKETLRMYPSAPSVSRRLDHDIVIDNYHLPKGNIVSLAIYQMHHDPDVWKDPQTFDPDRFLPENTHGRHAYSYIPFSAGPRNCIGQKFALLEMKTALTAILRKWKVRSVLNHSEVKPVQNIILRPHDERIDLIFTPLSKT